MSQDTSRRQPPHSLDAERAVLGSLLIDRDAILAIGPLVTVEDFYDRKLRTIFTAIQRLCDRQVPADLLTVADELASEPDADEATAELAALVSAVPTAVHVEYYARIIHEKAVRRRYIAACTGIIGNAYDESQPLESLIVRSMAAVNDAAAADRIGRVSSFKDLADDAWERLDKPQRGRVPVGFIDLNTILGGGLRPGQLAILAARPSVGKSALALQIGLHAGRQHIPVGIVSLEMHREELFDRAIAAVAEVNMHEYAALADEAKGDRRERIVRALGPLGEQPIFVHDLSNGSLADVITNAKALRMRQRIGLLIVDYLQLVTGEKRTRGNRTEEVGEVSRALKQLARELEIPVLALAQLNRAIELRSTADRVPQLSDLRESGSIEADADVVLFLWRPDQYDEKAEKNVALLKVAKQRNGPTGTLPLTWLPGTAQFGDYTSQRNDYAA